PQLPFHIEQYSFFSQFLFFVKNIFPIALHTIYENIERVEWFNINVLLDGFLLITLQPPKGNS
ncbi:MAG: hypothetical protein ACRC0A_06890, partial [Chitinophagaceae bacterium]